MWLALWLAARCPRDECLTGPYPVDATQLLNGALHQFVLAEAVERCDDIEFSRYQVCLDQVWKVLDFLEYALDFAFDFDQSEGERLFVRLFLVLRVGYAVDGEGRLGRGDSADPADLFDGVERFDWFVGLEPDHEVESSGDWCD